MAPVHIQNVERQNVDTVKRRKQNAGKTNRRHGKTSTITKRRQLRNVERLVLANRRIDHHTCIIE
jgi:hypothetical protein